MRTEYLVPPGSSKKRKTYASGLGTDNFTRVRRVRGDAGTVASPFLDAICGDWLDNLRFVEKVIVQLEK